MKAVIALGNPGAEYAKTRHNIGWQVIESYAKTHDATFIVKPKFNAEVAEVLLNNEKHLLIKPLTFYNEVGNSARAIANFYKLSPDDFLVIHDELALDLGVLRIRRGGSDAGNNGIKSINTHLGQSTWRLRIGTHQPNNQEVSHSGIVLGKLTQSELEVISKLNTKMSEAISQHLNCELQTTTVRE